MINLFFFQVDYIDVIGFKWDVMFVKDFVVMVSDYGFVGDFFVYIQYFIGVFKYEQFL